ncbi:MAG: TlpA family protein disulfide reductase [Gammaproteobacteria bacterium]|nr:TlpA family protein disulfide reductase [Gammaproteobacteria bacterium]
MSKRAVKFTIKPSLPPLLLGLLLYFGLSVAGFAAQTRTVMASDQTEITVNVYPADGKLLLLWQVDADGIQTADRTLAEHLARHGIEVWLPEILESYFLPPANSSMDKIPADAYLHLLTEALATHKSVVVLASGRGGIPLLRGVRQWQLQNSDTSGLVGAILLSPNLFVETPDPGQRPRLMPIVESTNLPIVVLQPDKSVWYWKLDQTVAGLRKGGSTVWPWRMANLRDRFYFRPDATNTEKSSTKLLPDTLIQATEILNQSPTTTRSAVATIKPDAPVRESKKDHVLSVYRGNPIPPLLHLPGLDGRDFDIKQFSGKVVVVNFWASWCPPCVQEMPSLQRLQQKLAGKPFTILGVNMAEDNATVRAFVKDRVQVNFPILLDKDGTALHAWRVFAFPTTYVVDKQGKIRYGLFGGVEWDSAEIIAKINGLLNEK